MFTKKNRFIFLLLIIALAAFFRMWQLDKIPPGLYHDEAINGNEALFAPGKVFYPENNGREGLFINLISLSFLIFKPSIWSLRLVSAVIGILTVLGLYLLTMQGEFVFTSFDTDDPEHFEHYGVRPAGHYVSRCTIPADFLNEGRYVLGMNASTFRVKRYFHDEHALAFNVEGVGAPGKHWPEPRLGPVRPRLEWSIERNG